MSEDKVKVSNFTPAVILLESNGVEYRLELTNEAVKKGDEMGIQNKFNNMGMLELLQNMILLFGQKHHAMTYNLSKKIAESIINEKEYNPGDVAGELIEEFVVRYQQVFTVEAPKKTLRKL